MNKDCDIKLQQSLHESKKLLDLIFDLEQLSVDIYSVVPIIQQKPQEHLEVVDVDVIWSNDQLSSATQKRHSIPNERLIAIPYIGAALKNFEKVFQRSCIHHCSETRHYTPQYQRW